MYSLNKAQIIGNVTADPEIRVTPNGQHVANFSVATNRRYTDKAGVQQDVPEYHNMVLWWKLAEIAEKYIKKGNKVYVEGRIETRSWEDQTGQKRYKTEIVGDQLIILTPKWANEGYSPRQEEDHGETPAVHSTIPPQEERVSIEDVPF